MSTRSIIVFTGNGNYNQPETIRLYKHSDGYPTRNLVLIVEAIEKAQKIILDDHNRFIRQLHPLSKTKLKTFSKLEALKVDPKSIFRKKEYTPEMLTGLTIGAATTVYGMGAQLEESFESELEPKHLGNQWDLEWIYIVDLIKKDVSIYTNSFKSGPQESFKKGTTDPVEYASELKEEYQKEEATKIKRLVKAIEDLGFTVNKPNKKYAKKPTEKGKSHGKIDMLVTSSGIECDKKV
jgi:hypothetical protein